MSKLRKKSKGEDIEEGNYKYGQKKVLNIACKLPENGRRWPAWRT